MKIYSGQTIEGTMAFTGDDGQSITDFTQMDIKILIRNRYDDYSILLEKSQMSIEGSKVSFSIPPEKTKMLKMAAIMELKVTESGSVKIAKCESIEVIDNLIKDM